MTDLVVASRVDELEKFMLSEMPENLVELPLIHRFTPGMYIREIFMPAGTVLTSKIHKTEHPFTVLSGKAKVWSESAGVQDLEAGYVGITQPGTQRVIVVLEDCRWATFHPLTQEEDLSKDIDRIEARLLEPSQSFDEYKRLLNTGVTALVAGPGGSK